MDGIEDVLGDNTDCSNSDGDGCSDGEEIAGGSDECSAISACLKADCNDNGINDDCETDRDGDGIIDDCDNCPDDANADQADADGDGTGDVCRPPCTPSFCVFCPATVPAILLGLLMFRFMSARRRFR